MELASYLDWIELVTSHMIKSIFKNPLFQSHMVNMLMFNLSFGSPCLEPEWIHGQVLLIRTRIWIQANRIQIRFGGIWIRQKQIQILFSWI